MPQPHVKGPYVLMTVISLDNHLQQGEWWSKFLEKVDQRFEVGELEKLIIITTGHSMRQESIVKAMRSRRARDRRALTGEAGNASRRKVICGRHGHELRRSECVPDAGRIAA
ncbi:hypothetical protein [Rickettsiella endosymbiont of Dermanyssus gallinae]|uniref:hypothetical protein n=1 Tax=Rickettsiella endosymbiont of Dermanyssus gallinae TaxID=2856608 RepID=UPI001C52D8A7|nr:hypothetical protein [Rickettsiella endosymbiont of Dermanyssus gallinae]